MPKPNTQIIIDAIIKEIEQGKSYTQALAANGETWRIPSRTFDRYWKTANEQHTTAQQAIKIKLIDIDTQAAIDARKKAIMSAEDRKEYLTKILMGEVKIKQPFVVSGKIMEYPAEPSINDRLKALAELNKMEGDYAPTKVHQTIQGGISILENDPLDADYNSTT